MGGVRCGLWPWCMGRHARCLLLHNLAGVEGHAEGATGSGGYRDLLLHLNAPCTRMCMDGAFPRLH